MLGVSAQRAHFADSLKNYAHAMFKRYGLQPARVYDEFPDLRSVSLPLLGKTPRDLWIAVGSALQNIHPTFWVDALFQGLPAGPTIIADVRFPREAEAIKAYGGLLIKISNPKVPEDTDGADEMLAEYAGWDMEIENTFDSRLLRRHAEDAAQKIKDMIDGKK